MNIYFISLGCDKNLVDSEMMISSLRKADFIITDDVYDADVIIVNTCCFIGDAKEESINVLLSMAEHRMSGKCILLVAAGCLAQRYHEEIKKEIPEVDLIIGTTGYEELAEDIKNAIIEEFTVENIKSVDYLPTPYTDRDSLTGGCYAYLKIAEGCDKCCTYCIIPKVRGKYRSVPMENLVAQAEHLAKNGVKEIILVAQETTLYGTDLYGHKALPELLSKLSEIEELVWIRILYCYPEEIDDELIEAMKRLPKVCHYLDIPVQHGSDDILRRMGRRTNKKEIIAIVEKLRSQIPDIIIRTTIITGFPGETQQDFEELKDFVKELRFDRLGVFTYSQEEDTPAADMENQIDEELKEKRRDEIMAIQQEIAFEKSESYIGMDMDVMIEGYLREDYVYIGRTYMDVPEVDGYVFVKSDNELMSGDYVTVKIIGSNEYDLIGSVYGLCLDSQTE